MNSPTITINNKEYSVHQDIADLLQAVSIERDDLQEELFLLKFNEAHKQDEYVFSWS